MNIGKTLFAQLMDFLPWTTFTRIVDRHGGDRYVKLLACTEQFRVMAFAQLAYRESLRDIEACLSAQAAKRYHMGFRHEIKRSTLADANETRDWRIHAEFAQCLIVQRASSTSATALASSWSTRRMRWTRRPSTCACRSFPGRCFAPPSRR
jgi:hypothetical protein